MTLTDAQIDRYSRQIIVPHIGGRGQERLLAARILLAGDARDIEAPLAYLVGAGVGSISSLKPSADQSLFTEKNFDLALVIIGSEAARKIAEKIANDSDVRALVIAQLDSARKNSGDSRCAQRWNRGRSIRHARGSGGLYRDARDGGGIQADRRLRRKSVARDHRVRRLRDHGACSSVMYKLWMFDFDNTIARLEPEVDWAGRPAHPRTLPALSRRARRPLRKNPARQSPALRRLPHADAPRL